MRTRVTYLEGSDTFTHPFQHGRQGSYANGDFTDLHILDVLSFQLQPTQALHGGLRMANQAPSLIGKGHAFVRPLHER